MYGYASSVYISPVELGKQIRKSQNRKFLCSFHYHKFANLFSWLILYKYYTTLYQNSLTHIYFKMIFIA
jgi:hypothetical protein